MFSVYLPQFLKPKCKGNQPSARCSVQLASNTRVVDYYTDIHVMSCSYMHFHLHTYIYTYVHVVHKMTSLQMIVCISMLLLHIKKWHDRANAITINGMIGLLLHITPPLPIVVKLGNFPRGCSYTSIAVKLYAYM